MTGPSPAKSTQPEEDNAPPKGPDTVLVPLSPGGLFEAFPGPALVVAGNGVVLGANDRAEPVVRLLQGDATGELRGAITAALGGKAAQITPLLLNHGKGSHGIHQAVDLVALPWADGAAVLLLGRDITLERSLRSALLESRQRYKDLVEASSDFAWETDAEGRFAFVSPRGALGYAASELVGRHAREFRLEGGDDGPSPFTTEKPVHRVELSFRDAAGRTAHLSVTGLPLPGPDGERIGARGVCRDITEERAREAALARARHRQRLLGDILRMVRDQTEPARMLIAVAEALVPALPAQGVAIHYRESEGKFARVAQAGSEAPRGMLEPLLAGLGSDGDLLESRSEAGCLLVMATRYRDRLNGALCHWRAAAVPGEEETALLDEVSAQIGAANQQIAREEGLGEPS